MTKEEIGLVLKKLRISCGMTQKEIAEKIGRKQQVIGHWETGYAQPDANTLFTLCDIYGVTVDDAFGFQKNKDISMDEYEHVKKCRFITEHSPNGTKTIETVLNNEYSIAKQLKEQKERIEELESSQATVIDIQPHLEVNAAHARTDIEPTDEMVKHDDDIMDDDDF